MQLKPLQLIKQQSFLALRTCAGPTACLQPTHPDAVSIEVVAITTPDSILSIPVGNKITTQPSSAHSHVL
jgi:hypothetical protein